MCTNRTKVSYGWTDLNSLIQNTWAQYGRRQPSSTLQKGPPHCSYQLLQCVSSKKKKKKKKKKTSMWSVYIIIWFFGVFFPSTTYSIVYFILFYFIYLFFYSPTYNLARIYLFILFFFFLQIEYVLCICYLLFKLIFLSLI